MRTSPLDAVLCILLSHALSQVHRQGHLGDEVDGIKGDAVELLGDDDGCRKRSVPCGHLVRQRDLVVCAVVTSVTTRHLFIMSRVPRFSNHDLLLVVVFLLCFFMWELADVGTG